MAEKTSDELRADSERKSKEATEQSQRNLRVVMSSSQGRAFVFELIDRECGVSSPSFREAPGTMAYLEGQRSIGIALQERLKLETRQLYLLMLREAFERVVDPDVKHETDQD